MSTGCAVSRSASIPITNSGPEPIIAELEKIVDSGENGLNQNLVKLQPVARLNAVMVVTKKAALLHTVETWIRRLDRSDSTRTSVHVYKVKYGDAKQIARVLTDMFGGGSSTQPARQRRQSDRTGIGTAASVGDRLSLNNNNNSNAIAVLAALTPRRRRAAASARATIQASARALAAPPAARTAAISASSTREMAPAPADRRCCKTSGSPPTSSTIRS